MELLQKLFKHSTTPKSKISLSWLNGFEHMDDISIIEVTTKKLSDEFKKNVFSEEVHLKALFSVDEKSHNIVERLTTHFVNVENINAELEERISEAICFYHRQLFLTYYTLIDFYFDQYQEYIQLFLARAFRNATQMIKWRYYNYQSAPANVWLQLSQLYRLAEKQALLNAKIQSYSDQDPVSLSHAYVYACMLGTLENLSLKCQQIELASKLLTAWTSKISIDKTYDERQHLFYVDTASNKPAKRIRNLKLEDTFRYWNFDSVNSKIELSISLIEFNISPKQPLMKELITHKDALETFELLHAEWSRVDYKRQRRSEDRSKTEKAVSTTFGFKEVCDQIKQYENIRTQREGRQYQGEKSLDERLASHTINRGEPNIIYMDLSVEHATIVDESSKGMGINVNKHANEVSLGMLVGISAKDQKNNTKLGMIRSIKPVLGNELHIGVELLSNIAFYAPAENVSLKTPKLAFSAGQFSNHNDPYFANTDFGDTSSFMNSSFGSDPTNFICLYLPREQSLSHQESLIIPKLQYNKNDIFKVNILGEDLLLRFTKSHERHGNWVRVTFTTDIERHQQIHALSSLPS
ncbi:MAG: hypothetical protein CVU29_04165 [Betaproteobacteria bacterium HGW-Betaproteobacteria-22]|nr:MAG: hypothetical protein CVU29_04165 [Betaproteobacteria bacterium HGW-Betaproteobacteria-22]